MALTHDFTDTLVFVSFLQFLDIGIITSVEINHKQVESARKGQEVCIKIDPIPGESPKMFGRHFDEKDMLVSKVSSTGNFQRKTETFFNYIYSFGRIRLLLYRTRNSSGPTMLMFLVITYTK